MSSTNSLNILKKPYSYALKFSLGHDCFIDSFNTARHEHENFTETSPNLSNFTTKVNTVQLSLPYPVSKATYINNSTDFCRSLLLEKKEYDCKVNLYLDQYKGHKKWLTKKYVGETNQGKLPKYIFDLAKGYVQDPDTYFNGNYNWYYSGGVLDKCIIFNEEHLIYPNHENLICIKNGAEESRIKVKQLDKTPIFSVRCYTDDNIILLRQKYKVCMLKIKTANDKLSLTSSKTEKCNDDVPYIDVKYNRNELSTLTLNHKIKTTDLHNEKQTIYDMDELDTKPSDEFGQFDYFDNNNFLFLDRISVRTYDKRSRQGNHFIVEDSWFKCDELCNFIRSNNTDYLFLSSVHKIIKFDLRQMRVVKTWAHLLPSPPLMMKTEDFCGNELIFTSTQNYGDRIVLLSNNTESNFVQLVPNMVDTLEECNKFYKFNLHTENEKRLQYSIAGINMVQNLNSINLYTCNTVGDVFENIVSQDLKLDSTEPLQKLNSWLESFPKTHKPLIVTNFRELSHVKNILKEPVHTSSLEAYTRENKKRANFLKDMAIENVDMAAIWLNEDDEEKVDIISTEAAVTKVSAWLEEADYNSDDYLNENIFQ